MFSEYVGMTAERIIDLRTVSAVNQNMGITTAKSHSFFHDLQQIRVSIWEKFLAIPGK